MKKFIAILTITTFLFTFYGCGNNKEIKSKTYGTYGLLNESDMKNPNVEYRLIIGNIIWSCILVETIIAPIYFIGFSLYEPVGIKTTIEKGVVSP